MQKDEKNEKKAQRRKRKYARIVIDTIEHRALVSFGSLGATVLLFLLLPAINRIAGGKRADTIVTPIDTAEIPPPDVIEEEEVEEEEPEEEEPPPELEESVDPLDLSQLEMAMNADFGGPGVGGDFSIDLSRVMGAGGLQDQFGAGGALGSKRRIISEPPPNLSGTEKKATPGKVIVVMKVDGDGRVIDAKILSSSNPVLNAPTLRALDKWRFERLSSSDGQPVVTHHKRVINYPKL